MEKQVVPITQGGWLLSPVLCFTQHSFLPALRRNYGGTLVLSWSTIIRVSCPVWCCLWNCLCLKAEAGAPAAAWRAPGRWATLLCPASGRPGPEGEGRCRRCPRLQDWLPLCERRAGDEMVSLSFVSMMPKHQEWKEREGKKHGCLHEARLTFSAPLTGMTLVTTD